MKSCRRCTEWELQNAVLAVQIENRTNAYRFMVNRVHYLEEQVSYQEHALHRRQSREKILFEPNKVQRFFCECGIAYVTEGMIPQVIYAGAQANSLLDTASLQPKPTPKWGWYHTLPRKALLTIRNLFLRIAANRELPRSPSLYRLPSKVPGGPLGIGLDASSDYTESQLREHPWMDLLDAQSIAEAYGAGARWAYGIARNEKRSYV